MSLHREFIRQGGWLFRWRSYLPFIIVPFLLVLLSHAEIIEQTMGDLADTFYEILCVIVSFLGLGVRCFVIGTVPSGTSGRNTRTQIAQVLNTTGMYSVVRHPLYVGNFLIYLGLALFPQVWWGVVVYGLLFWIYYERIMFREEEFLREKFGKEFELWAEKTPAFMPQWKNYKKPSMPFSWRNVLRREYSAVLGICIGFPAMDMIIGLIKDRTFDFDGGWCALWIVGMVFFVICRFLKKNTTVLDVEGRR